MNLKIVAVFVLSVASGFGICSAINASVEPVPSSTTNDMSSMDQTEAGMAEQMKQLSSELDDKFANALDKAFIENMIIHHQGAVEMAKKVVDKTKRPEVKALAEEIISSQSKEIEIMQGWLKAWYGI